MTACGCLPDLIVYLLRSMGQGCLGSTSCTRRSFGRLWRARDYRTAILPQGGIPAKLAFLRRPLEGPILQWRPSRYARLSEIDSVCGFDASSLPR
jgi:hypothetical protein